MRFSKLIKNSVVKNSPPAKGEYHNPPKAEQWGGGGHHAAISYFITTPFFLMRCIRNSFPSLAGGELKPLFAILAFSILLLAPACKTTDQNEPMPPVISLKSMSKDTLVQFADSLNITIRYSDVNGDLGSSDPDNNTLYIKDSRLDSADYYHVKPLSPPNSNLKIQGELTVKVRNMFLLGNGGNESAYFTIKLRDQSGQWSNEVITTPVVITQ